MSSLCGRTIRIPGCGGETLTTLAGGRRKWSAEAVQTIQAWSFW
jgi:hypothetical protein